jgi:benzoate/toluate 1,2-dioxygenase beta subunit
MTIGETKEIDEQAVQKFLVHEAALLDERRFEEWMDLFADDGYYWVPLSPNQQSPDAEASLFYDNREFMRTRFERLRHPRIHSQIPHHRTCHVVGNIVSRWQADTGTILVQSNMIMADYRQGVQRIFSGRVHHHLRFADDRFWVLLKRVDLINCDDAFELVAVPF